MKASTYLKKVTLLPYADPVPVLLKYREIEEDPDLDTLPQNVRTLRTSDLKSAREGREAALFALGLEQVLGTKVLVAPVESGDFDFVLRWEKGDQVHYCPGQIKELVSEERNPKASLPDLLERLSIRPKTETVLLVRLNRKEDVDLAKLPLRNVPYRELWFLWQSSPDASRWSILGDALATAYRTDFSYPQRTKAPGPV